MKRFLITAGAAATLIAGSALAAPSAFARPTLPNGFTAKVIAHSWQTIRGTINASGYDLGIYIGPGVHDVRVLGAHVSGANDEGILVQDTHDVLIEDSTVDNNTKHPAPNLSELKGISLTGTHNVVITGNRVFGNGDGGIGVYDDGPNSSSTNAPVAIDRQPVPSYRNYVFGNTVKDNLVGCGIVIAAKNPGGAGVHDNTVANNAVLGFDPATGDMTPAVGGIVVAGGQSGAVTVDRNVVMGNTVTGGFIPGIAVHATSPGQVTRTVLLDNRLARNGAGAGGKSTGIELATKTSRIDSTQIIRDNVSNDYYGVFHVGDTHTDIDQLSTSGVTVRVGP